MFTINWQSCERPDSWRMTFQSLKGQHFSLFSLVFLVTILKSYKERVHTVLIRKHMQSNRNPLGSKRNETENRDSFVDKASELCSKDNQTEV